MGYGVKRINFFLLSLIVFLSISFSITIQSTLASQSAEPTSDQVKSDLIEQCAIDQGTLLLNTIIEDMKRYKMLGAGSLGHPHAGNLYEHSVWVALTIKQWFEDKNLWCEGLDDADKELVIFAALLHDIGKAGDLIYSYPRKPNHPLDGFEYLLSKKNYKIDDKNKFDFAQFFKVFNISDENKKIIAVLVGAHYLFGDLLSKNPTNKDSEHFRWYIKNIEILAEKAELIGKHDKINEKLVRLCVLTSAADVKGMQPFVSGSREKSTPDKLSVFGYTIYFTDADPVKKAKETNNWYDFFDYENKGKQVRDDLLEYLKR
jgi:putative nucleotidyltransferase with HDIG domain